MGNKSSSLLTAKEYNDQFQILVSGIFTRKKYKLKDLKENKELRNSLIPYNSSKNKKSLYLCFEDVKSSLNSIDRSNSRVINFRCSHGVYTFDLNYNLIGIISSPLTNRKSCFIKYINNYIFFFESDNKRIFTFDKNYKKVLILEKMRDFHKNLTVIFLYFPKFRLRFLINNNSEKIEEYKQTANYNIPDIRKHLTTREYYDAFIPYLKEIPNYFIKSNPLILLFKLEEYKNTNILDFNTFKFIKNFLN